MVIENKLTKKQYGRLVLKDLFFGSKASFIILLLYMLLWRVLYTITKIGQLKKNVSIFIGLILLLTVMFFYIISVYRKRMNQSFLYQAGSRIEIKVTEVVIVSGNTADRHVFPLETLKSIKENKGWYFLSFQNHTFIPLLKNSLNQISPLNKPPRPVFWEWTVLFLFAVTVIGGYYVGRNAVNFNGALAWKIQELKTDTDIKLKNDNFYETRLEGILDDVRSEMDLEPYLMTNDLKIDFARNGTIKEIYIFLYGFDQNQKLQSSYLIYTKGGKVKVHKQDWHGQGTEIYDPNNDLSVVVKMLNWIPLKNVVAGWDGNHYAVLYKGIRKWGIVREGIVFLDKNGGVIPAAANSVNEDPTVSLYIPGKEDSITPKRYIYKPFFHEE